MKALKTLLFSLFLLSVLSINAQEKKVTFGIKAGLNLSNVGSSKGNYDNTKTKAGFHAGFTLDYAFTPEWYLLTGLEYTLKGVTIELSTDQEVTAAYVQLPLSAAYKLSLSEETAIVMSLGPYFAYGVHGKIKQGNYEQDTFSKIALKKFDSGMNFGVALEYQKFCFTMGGELGFVNIMQKYNDKAETRNFKLSVGYKF
ncbi:porin family protein [Prevotella sp. 10(H)]|uniref:porin family protein n=1 Tax=Prevotella sp. 10(H) TaxID=1158294 RepID=UPI00068E0568|nr:porin family protein [Prevotella sp. 10(H)]